MHPGAYNDVALIEVIKQLRVELRGDRATLLWDGLSGHWSGCMRAFLASQRHWLVVERLPAYAPELNPVESLWANLKGTELANLCAETLDEPIKAAHRGVERVRSDEDLHFGFLKAAGLSL